MIGHLHTSALVPLLVAEPSSASCRRFWNDADLVTSSRLLYVETAAALAQARRMNCLTNQAHLASLRILDRLWSEMEMVEVDELVVARAARLAPPPDIPDSRPVTAVTG